MLPSPVSSYRPSACIVTKQSTDIYSGVRRSAAIAILDTAFLASDSIRFLTSTDLVSLFREIVRLANRLASCCASMAMFQNLCRSRGSCINIPAACASSETTTDSVRSGSGGYDPLTRVIISKNVSGGVGRKNSPCMDGYNFRNLTLVNSLQAR